MLPEGSDLVATIDRVIALYAPLLASWMDEHPGAQVITALVGGDEPSAYAEQEDGEAYSDDRFDEISAGHLRSLAGQTSAVRDGCPLLGAAESPFDVMAVREKGRVRITVSVADPFQSATVSRSLLKNPRRNVFVAETCHLEIISFIRDLDLLSGYRAAADEGLSELIEFALHNRIVANLPDGQDDMLREWISGFAAPMRVVVRNLDGLGDVLVARVGSAKSEMYVLAEEGEDYEKALATAAAAPELVVYPYPPVATAGRPAP
jgi:hypothetical protein